MTQAIILNGPPRCGKDTGAEFLTQHPAVCKTEFKQRLIAIALVISGMSREEWDSFYHEDKDKPHPKLNGLTPRQFLIDISERCIKPMMGDSYFGRAVLAELYKAPVTVFSDSGFQAELDCVITELGAENVLVVRIERPGCNFNIDSRNYLPSHVTVLNLTTVNDFCKQLEFVVDKWLRTPKELRPALRPL